MEKHKRIPILYNPIIYNPAYIDYYILEGLLKFREKFYELHPHLENSDHNNQLSLQELKWMRLKTENVLSEIFLKQKDETRLLFEERIVTIFILVLCETVILHSKGFLMALFTVLPTAGCLDTAATIIAKHRAYKNDLYGGCVISLEDALAIVKSPARNQNKEEYDKTLSDKIHEAEEQIAVKREEIKNAWPYPSSRSRFFSFIDRFMFLLCRVLAAFRILGIRVPSAYEKEKWKRAINKIAPLVATANIVSQQDNAFIKDLS
jgi:hypothetical protein